MRSKYGMFFGEEDESQNYHKLEDSSISEEFSSLQKEFKEREGGLFSYPKMLDQLGAQGAYEGSLFINKGFAPGFIFIHNLKLPNSDTEQQTTWRRPPLKRSIDPVGWKLHISVAREERNLEIAWEVMQFVCLKYNLAQLKTPEPAWLSKLEQGKEFCLFLFKNPHIKDWSAILNAMEYLLKQNSVKHGVQPSAADKKVEGSNYLYYRHDARSSMQKGDNYICAEEAILLSENDPTIKAYNPSDALELLEGLSISAQISKLEIKNQNTVLTFM